VLIALHPLAVQGREVIVEIYNSSFERDEDNFSAGVDPVYINKVPVIFRSDVQFEDNKGSSLAVVGVLVDLKCSLCLAREKEVEQYHSLANARVLVNDATRMIFAENFTKIYG